MKPYSKMRWPESHVATLVYLIYWRRWKPSSTATWQPSA